MPDEVPPQEGLLTLETEAFDWDYVTWVVQEALSQTQDVSLHLTLGMVAGYSRVIRLQTCAKYESNYNHSSLLVEEST